METICMKCQILFVRQFAWNVKSCFLIKIRKIPTILLSAELAKRVPQYIYSKYSIVLNYHPIQRPVLQSIVSLVVKMLTVLVSIISNLQVFLLKKKTVSSICTCKSYSHFFSKNISIHGIFNDQSFNNMLANRIVSFEQLGPDLLKLLPNFWSFSYYSPVSLPHPSI